VYVSFTFGMPRLRDAQPDSSVRSNLPSARFCAFARWVQAEVV